MSGTGRTVLVLVIVLMSVIVNAQTRDGGMPRLESQGTATQLIVGGKPFLMLAGETGNSSASDLKYLEVIWPKVVKMNLNTLLVPVYWELIEPEEGKLDFKLLDVAIKSARKHNIKLVLLWFGTWKNRSGSSVAWTRNVCTSRYGRPSALTAMRWG